MPQTQDMFPAELPELPPPGKFQRLLATLIGVCLGAGAGLAVSGIVPAGMAFLLPLLSSVAGVAVANRVLTLAWQQRLRQQQEELLLRLQMRRHREQALPQEKERAAEPEQVLLRGEQKADFEQAVHTLVAASSAAETLKTKTTTIKGVDVPEYVLAQIRRRYDPHTLTREQLIRAVNAAFADGRVFDDEHAAHGFDDELHIHHHERPQTDKPKTFVETLEEEKKAGDTREQGRSSRPET